MIFNSNNIIRFLADVRQSGSLNQSEFIIAMHYIAKLMDGTLSSLPDKLPPAVFQSANGNTTQPSPLVRNMTINSPAVGFRPPAPSHPMMTPPQRARTIDSLGNLAFGASNEPAAQTWDVSARERQQFGAYFDKIDANHVGLIQGKEAVEFFKNSRLPEAELAHIWDLSDIQQRGALSRDEFAVAMYLIHKRLAGEQLPQTLPKSLIPPSHVPLQSPFTNVVSSPSIYHPPAPAQRSTPDHDLLGDFGNEGVAHETNQVNLLSNQVSSLSMHKNDVQQQKNSAEDTLDQLIKQRKDLEAQMASLRMAHEAAVKDLNEIQETVRREEGEWDQVRSEYDASQQALTTIQNEIAQTQQTLENGRAETESLRRRVHEIGEETKKAQTELENLRSQNKQTNMMLDINRRQVTAAEQDRSLAKRNLEDYKVASNLSGANEQVEEASILPTETEPTSVSTPALQNLFADSPSMAHPSPFNESDKNTTPVFDDAFSPSPVPPVSDNDFDAIFGNISTPTTQTPVNAFDPWVTTPTTQVSTPGTKTSRGPPPPPPQSRHHRQTSEVSSIASVVSTPSGAKKHRAPPPPPPVGLFSPTMSTPQINEQENDSEDDFEAAFSGKLPEAKIVTKTNDEEDEFADFDDAFSSFDTVKPVASPAPVVASPAPVAASPAPIAASPAPVTAAPAKKEATPVVDNWPSNFGGFSFASDDQVTNKPSPPVATSSKDEDWDSIFGTTTTTTTTKTTAPETSSDGFDDAFSSFGDDFGKQSTPTLKTTNVKTQPQKTMSVGSIGIVGDKIEELVKIGFNEKEAKDALNRYDQDLEKATNFLLDQSSKA